MSAQVSSRLLQPTPLALLAREAREARRFFRAEDGAGRDGWRVVGAGRETLAGGAYLQQRDFPYYKIEYVEAGRGWVELGGLRQALTAGRVYVVAPDSRVGLRSDAARPLRRWYLWLEGPGAGAKLATCDLDRPRVRIVAAPGEIREAWEWLLREGEREGPGAVGLVRALVEVVLLKLAEAREGGTAETDAGARETFERCRALVDTEAGRLAGAAQLAATAGLRTETVCRLFRRFLDTTPGAYLRTRRMRLAAEKLRLPGARVKAVAAELGFADAFHFSRVFKAEIGVPPREWRARQGERMAGVAGSETGRSNQNLTQRRGDAEKRDAR